MLRYIGGERAVVVGVWRTGGQRYLPVNAELDFDRDEQRARAARRPRGQPARLAYDEGARGDAAG